MKNVKDEGSLIYRFKISVQEIWFKTFNVKGQLEISREKDKKLLLSVSIWVPPR